MNIYIVLYYKPFISKRSEWYGPCVTVGHSFTCHSHTNCLYSSAARRHCRLASTHCAYPRRDGQAKLTWVAGHINVPAVPHRKLNPDTVTHLSSNRARRRLTSLIEANALLQRQTSPAASRWSPKSKSSRWTIDPPPIALRATAAKAAFTRRLLHSVQLHQRIFGKVF